MRGYFVVRDDGKNDAINYLDTVLTEVSEDHGVRGEANPLERWHCFELNVQVQQWPSGSEAFRWNRW